MSWNMVFNSFKLIFHLGDVRSKIANLEGEVVKLRMGDIPKIADIERGVVELRVECTALKDRINKLEEIINKFQSQREAPDKTNPLPVKREDVIYHGNLLWLKGEKTPYCQRCYEADNKLVHMQIIETSIATTRYRPPASKSYHCPNCKQEAPIVKPPEFS